MEKYDISISVYSFTTA